MAETVPIIVTVNRMEEGNRAYRSLADPQSYRPLWGEEAGDVIEGGEARAGRRLTYRVHARVIEDLGPQDTVAAFRAQNNVFSAELDEKAYGIPEDVPPRIPEAEVDDLNLALTVPVPEEAVQRYAGLLGSGLTGAGSVHPKGVEVAVLDTGLDREWARLLTMQDVEVAPSVVNHQQFTDEPHTALEAGHFHGSHCQGIFSAGTDLRVNVAQVLDDGGSGYTSWVMDGLYWAVRNGCRVANLSLGGGRFSQAMADAVAYAASRGCLVVCAMGNDGVYERQYPAGYARSTAVIASSYRDGMRAPFSNYGEWAHGTTDGVGVLSWGLDGALVRASGTSMATPLYARVLALLVAEYGLPSRVLKVAGGTSQDTPEPVLEEGNGRIHAGAAAAELRGA